MYVTSNTHSIMMSLRLQSNMDVMIKTNDDKLEQRQSSWGFAICLFHLSRSTLVDVMFPVF